MKTPNTAINALIFAGALMATACHETNQTPDPDITDIQSEVSSDTLENLDGLEPEAESDLPSDLPPESICEQNLEYPGPMEILTHPNFQEIREHLETNFMFDHEAQCEISLSKMLKRILIDQEFDPFAENHTKAESFSREKYQDQSDYKGNRTLVIGLAHSLTLEAQGNLPWSLTDYSAEELKRLFIIHNSLKSFERTGPGSPGFDLPPYDSTDYHFHTLLLDEHIEEAHMWQLHLAKELTKDAQTQEQAIHILIEWVQNNFFHIYRDDQNNWDFEEAYQPYGIPYTLEDVYDQRAIGCHIPTLILEGMLHSLNIPAVRLHMFGHGVLYLPTLNSYVHGDHVATGTGFDPQDLIFTEEEFLPYLNSTEANASSDLLDLWLTKIVSVYLTLRRQDNTLYIDDILPEGVFSPHRFNDFRECDPSDQLNAIVTNINEFGYGVELDTNTCTYTGDFIPIQSLEQLSATP